MNRIFLYSHKFWGSDPNAFIPLFDSKHTKKNEKYWQGVGKQRTTNKLDAGYVAQFTDNFTWCKRD